MPAPKDPQKYDEWREKISKNNGMKNSEEARLKSSISHMGISPPNKGLPMSEEQKQKLRDAWVIRKLKYPPLKHSDDTKLKISAAHTGRKHTEESRKNMSVAHIGKPLTKSHIESLIKHRRSPEFRKQQSERMSGENCIFWKGGVSFEPYCIKFNKEFKTRVREYFKNVCVECGKSEQENGKKMCVHHVNYDKDVCCNETKPQFVTLCISCHLKTNLNRDYWEDYFTEMINSKYNGKCYFTKDEYYGTYTTTNTTND